MTILNKLINLLSVYVKDTASVSEEIVRNFAVEQNISLRDDHLRFLMRFGSQSNGRAEIFRQYGGDFDFETFKWVYLEKEIEMEPPPGTAFFGSGFAGHALCIAADSGKIYLYESAMKYSVVHGSVDGFLFGCMLFLYHEDAFANVLVNRDVGSDYINSFRIKNAKKKLVEATSFEFEYEAINNPEIREEYYLIDGELVAFYPGSGNLVTMSGGILDGLNL